MRVAFTRSVVASWTPEQVSAGTDKLNEVADLVSERGSRASRTVAGLRETHGWSGDAQSAASDWAAAELRRTEDLSRATRTLASVVHSELQAVGDRRIALLGAVSSAEADGLTVDEHWAVLGSAADVEVQRRHERDIGQCLSGLMRADATAAQAVARALDEFRAMGDDVRGFVPVAIGLAFLIDAAVSLLISAGVVSAGAILFALVEEFGIDSWDMIESAVPSSFFEDSGPVDAEGVRDRVADATVPGRNSRVRQVESEAEVHDLWEALTAEGQATDPGSYPGTIVKLPDGTIVRMRESSHSGGATLDITYSGGERVKVHTA